MRTDTSHPHHPGMLRHAALSAMLVCAGCFAGISGASAQDAAGPGAEPVQASLGDASVPASDLANTVIARSAADPSPASTQTPAQPLASASDTPVSNDDSVAIADSGAGKKVFVTGASVTRYDVASLDDRVLGNQRGRAVGMLMVAAVPDAFRNNSVTLWDEIAPPTQSPQPVGAAAGAGQSGNIVNYTRK